MIEYKYSIGAKQIILQEPIHMGVGCNFSSQLLSGDGKDSLGRYAWFRQNKMVVDRKPMTCPKCSFRISFLSSLFRLSNLSFECPNCKTRIGVRLDRKYWTRQLITVPVYLGAIFLFIEFTGFDSIFNFKNMLIVLLIGILGTYEGWRLFWNLEVKNKSDPKEIT